MGRHSQTSSISTTLVGLGMLAQRSVSTAPAHGRRRAEGPARTSVAPVMLRAGGTAAALALAVSGGAYAAVNASGDSVSPIATHRPTVHAIGTNGTTTVKAATATVTTVTEESQDPYQSVQEETAALPKGQTQVKTAGVNGVVRTTYQVTSQDGKEVSREAVSTVTVSQRVDEVVLVGTADTTAAATAVTGDAAVAQSIAHSMVLSRGWGEDQFSCLVKLWNKESHWNAGAQNKSSGAYGIPQALPGSKMASAGADWRTNPTTQITWGLGYIAGRYGNPCGAWAHSQSTGWY